jgi:hypothetical protein
MYLRYFDPYSEINKKNVTGWIDAHCECKRCERKTNWVRTELVVCSYFYFVHYN